MNVLLVRAPFGFPFREIENTENARFGLMLEARVYKCPETTVI